tara:strand:+ start:310 stop:468 length:159 start_codon:yes stop_codon:yes gene_type:complete
VNLLILFLYVQQVELLPFSHSSLQSLLLGQSQLVVLLALLLGLAVVVAVRVF